MSLWDFAGPENLDDADNAAVLSTGLLAAVRGDATPLTPGAGLIWHQNSLSAVILANAKFLNIPAGGVMGWAELPSDNPIRQRVTQALGGERPWFQKVRVRSVTPPGLQLSPGGAITKPAGGTAGCQVTWSGKKGFLTAGHVAPNKGSDVHDASGKVGTVVWANNPAGHGTSIEPDVAVVECTSSVTVNPTVSQSVKAGPAATITVTKSGKRDSVKGFALFIYLDLGNQVTATVGDTYYSDNEITVSGDSGGPVMLGADLIGHVVGSSPGVCTYIQAVDYQIQEAATRGGLTGLRL